MFQTCLASCVENLKVRNIAIILENLNARDDIEVIGRFVRDRVAGRNESVKNYYIYVVNKNWRYLILFFCTK